LNALYFFSGFDREQGFTTEIGKSLLHHIKEKKSLAYIASCPYDHEKTDLYSGVNATWFHNIGIDFESIVVIDDRKSESECMEEIKNASAVFLAGGTTYLQFDFIQKNNLIPLLKKFNGVIMGMSAGAINMAVNAFYSADKDYSKTHVYKGIGLADITIDPHFSIDNKDLLNIDILPFTDILDIYAICDNGAIVISGTERKYYGDVYLASKGEIEKIN